ncbi:MAG: SMP-30/gluconolactonase/LRE family protein [Cyclobacteriaceae bacterium]
MKRILLALLTIIGVYVSYVLMSTGFFRTIEPTHTSKDVILKLDIIGAEDFALSYADSFMIVSADDRQWKVNDREHHGGLYLVDLSSSNPQPKFVFGGPGFFPHGLTMYKIDSSTYKVWVINHADGHTIETFELYNNELIQTNSLSDPLAYSPNDLVAVDENKLYITNDHLYHSGLGSIAENYFGLSTGSVVYYDGSKFEQVADGFGYANGLAFQNNRLFVAATREFSIKVYDVLASGQLNLVEIIDANTGVDNIEIGPTGKMWIASHPNLLDFVAYANGENEIAPSEIITLNYQGKSDYKMSLAYLEGGNIVSASSTALPFSNYLIIGNVADTHVPFVRLNH